MLYYITYADFAKALTCTFFILPLTIREELAEAELNNRKISKSELELFFRDLRSIDIKDYSSKRTLIDTFVNKILLWDEKLIIIYNFTPMLDSKNELPEEELNDIIKTVSDCSDTAPLGSSSPARTDDPAVNSRMLCQLSYRGIS